MVVSPTTFATWLLRFLKSLRQVACFNESFCSYLQGLSELVYVPCVPSKSSCGVLSVSIILSQVSSLGLPFGTHFLASK